MATKMKLTMTAVYPDNPKPGQLCVWNMTDPPYLMDRYAVVSLDEAKGLIRKLTDEQLQDKTVACNAFGLEVYQTAKDDPKDERQSGEWVDWESPEGDNILDVMDAEDADRAWQASIPQR